VYAAVFAMEAVGLLVCVALLRRASSSSRAARGTDVWEAVD